MNAAMKHQPESAAGWLKAIKRFDWAGDHGLAKLKDESLRFLGTDWLDVVMMAGWDELEIWGCFPAPLEFARRRYDALGLVPALLLLRGGKLVEVDHRCAVVERKGVKHRTVLRHPRELPGRAFAQPWWQALHAASEEQTPCERGNRVAPSRED